jgi:hypothetical protein
MSLALESRTRRLAGVDDDLAALYAEETGQSEWLCRVYLAQDEEPPPRYRTMQIGFTTADLRIIAPFLSDPDDEAVDA